MTGKLECCSSSSSAQHSCLQLVGGVHDSSRAATKSHSLLLAAPAPGQARPLYEQAAGAGGRAHLVWCLVDTATAAVVVLPQRHVTSGCRNLLGLGQQRVRRHNRWRAECAPTCVPLQAAGAACRARSPCATFFVTAALSFGPTLMTCQLWLVCSVAAVVKARSRAWCLQCQWCSVSAGGWRHTYACPCQAVPDSPDLVMQ